MAGFARDASMIAGERKASLVVASRHLRTVLPTGWRVASLAAGSELVVMNVLMTARTFGTGFLKVEI